LLGITMAVPSASLVSRGFSGAAGLVADAEPPPQPERAPISTRQMRSDEKPSGRPNRLELEQRIVGLPSVGIRCNRLANLISTYGLRPYRMAEHGATNCCGYTRSYARGQVGASPGLWDAD
jgi:hypothetical protein